MEEMQAGNEERILPGEGGGPSSAPSSQSPIRLNMAAKFLPGVGPQRGELLSKIGIRTAQDALFQFPRSYEFPAPRRDIQELQADEPAAILGRVVEIDHRVTQAGKSLLGVLVADSTGSARLIFFNQAFRADQIRRDMMLLVSGTPRLAGMRMEFVHPKIEPIFDVDTDPAATILPTYGLTEGLPQPIMRRLMSRVVEHLADQVPEVLPESLRGSFGLMGIAQALRSIHQPVNEEELEKARKRFVFQELFVLQLALALRRRRLTTELQSPVFAATPEINAAIFRRFPFTLTGDQRRAIDEVAIDMGRQFPMNRLVQGDVGSGKTVVAQYAMLLAVAYRSQAVLMAPTDILARQHFETFSHALESSRVRVGLMTGSLKSAERRNILERSAAGDIDLLIGTQALLHGEIALPRLGLVVIDEQHKFGVNQRAKLRGDSLAPHYLVLSATPIPRTMAMTYFGDLDQSILREKPPGRGVVKTYLAKEDWKNRWWSFVAEKIDEGRQAYVVTPLVSGKGEEHAGSPPSEAPPSSAEAVFEELSSGPLKNYRLGLLHGRLSGEEKAEVMRRFAEGRLQVLVSTTVIEVGINVPNATVMTILGAQRFGLAQLHQLRGRVSRGKHPGHVGIFTDGGIPPEENERLQVLAECEDGFELAEADYRLRGPGDLLGVRQSGIPPLMIADPDRDQAILMMARSLAQSILDEDPELEHASFALLRKQMLRRYGAVLQLGDVA